MGKSSMKEVTMKFKLFFEWTISCMKTDYKQAL
jgi:hypothetical protein